MATIQDVARYAHVGAATVSRVLSGNGYVKAETREKVRRAIEALNYTPNEMARNLFYQRSGIVAVIVPRISNPFFAEFVNDAEAAFCAAGYQTMISNTWSERNYELRYLDMLRRRMVDGIIFASHTLDVAQYQNIQRPIVALDRNLGPDIPSISVDHEEGGRLAAMALIEAGCRNVLQFRGSGIVRTMSHLRHEAFERVTLAHGVACRNCVMEWNSMSYEYYAEATERMMRENPDVDGVFAVDAIAMNALRYAAEQGIRVPQDLKIVSYDGTGVARLASPSLTMICQPIQRLAEECVRVMMELIQGNAAETKHIRIPVRIQRGASTAKEVIS